MSDQTDALLAGILQRLNSEEYESLGIYTVGGAPGNYQLRTPVNTEVEYLVVGAYLAVAPSQVSGEGATTILNLPSSARATYAVQQFNVAGVTTLSLIFNVTALTGGASPTVTFKISTVGADGTVQQLEQAAAISSAGTINYSIGPGLDNKDFGSTIQVDMVTTGAPTSITFSASIIGKGPIVAAATQGTVVITNNNPVVNFTLGTSLGATSSGGDMGNVFEGVVLPSSATINSLIAVDYWMPAGRGATINVLVITAASYALIAVRRKLARYIPVRERVFPHTHSQPPPRRWERLLPAASPQVEGFVAQYPTPGGAPYQHQDGPPVDPAWQRRSR